MVKGHCKIYDMLRGAPSKPLKVYVGENVPPTEPEEPEPVPEVSIVMHTPQYTVLSIMHHLCTCVYAAIDHLMPCFPWRPIAVLDGDVEQAAVPMEHFWNIVKVAEGEDVSELMVDACAAVYLGAESGEVQTFCGCDTAMFVLDHLPEDEAKQNLPEIVSKETFINTLHLRPGATELGVRWCTIYFRNS